MHLLTWLTWHAQRRRQHEHPHNRAAGRVRGPARCAAAARPGAAAHPVRRLRRLAARAPEQRRAGGAGLIASLFLHEYRTGDNDVFACISVYCRNQEGWQTRRVAAHCGVHDCGAQCGKWAACVQRAYWKQHLAGAPALLELPTDFPRPPQPSGRGRVVSFEVPAEVVGGVRALAASCSATLFMALMAAWQVNALQQYSMTDCRQPAWHDAASNS